MAKWRALHKDVSISGQVNHLTEFEKLLFTWMIAHADDWGVLTGDPEEVKLMVMPGTDRQLQEIADALRHIADVGLIWLYQPDGYGPLVQFCEWDIHQHIRKERRTDPRHPTYDKKHSPPTMPDNDGQSQEKTAYTTLHHTTPDNTTSSPNGEAKPKRKKPDTAHHRVVDGYMNRISKGYSKRHKGKFAGDVKAIKQMLGRDHSEETILAYYDNQKAGWWSTQHLSMRTIDENIDDWVKSGGKRGTHKQGDGLTPEQISQYFPEP